MFVPRGYLLVILVGMLLALGGALLGFLPATVIVGVLIVLAVGVVTLIGGSR